MTDDEVGMKVTAIVTKMMTAGFDEDGKLNFEEFEKNLGAGLVKKMNVLLYFL